MHGNREIPMTTMQMYLFRDHDISRTCGIGTETGIRTRRSRVILSGRCPVKKPELLPDTLL